MSTGTSLPSVGDERFASYVAAWKRRARKREEEERRLGTEALEKVLSDCPASLRERIEQEGIVIHEG